MVERTTDASEDEAAATPSAPVPKKPVKSKWEGEDEEDDEPVVRASSYVYTLHTQSLLSPYIRATGRRLRMKRRTSRLRLQHLQHRQKRRARSSKSSRRRRLHELQSSPQEKTTTSTMRMQYSTPARKHAETRSGSSILTSTMLLICWELPLLVVGHSLFDAEIVAFLIPQAHRRPSWTR